MSIFTEGEPFESEHALLDHLLHGGWVKAHGRSIHPSWAMSWQITALKGFRGMRPLYRKDGTEDKAPWRSKP